jgi:hypothetical protein
MMQSNQSAAPMMPQQAGAQPGADDQAPAICIQQQPDGTYLVYSEADGPDAGQSMQDVDSALQAAKQMLTGEPDADDNGGVPDGDADNAAESMFQSGFNGARGPGSGR